MFTELFYELRARKVPVATQDWLLLMRALELGLHDSSLDGFYHLARAVCVKDVAHFDAFDVAWLKVFKGIEHEAIDITEQLKSWLADPKLRGVPRLRKRPSTSELIDWIAALRRSGVDLKRIGGGLPFIGTLLKTEQDVELVAKA